MPRGLFSAGVFLFISAQTFAQDDTRLFYVAGVVLDSVTRTPIPDVHVSILQRGVSTDKAGLFSILVSNENKLMFSHIGYRPCDISILGGSVDHELTILMSQRVRVLSEINIVDHMEEEQLKNAILKASAPESRELRILKENSAAINALGNIAPLPVPTLSEQYFESLQGPKDVVLFSSNPNHGLIKAIRNLSNPPRVKSVRQTSGYRSNPEKVTPFKVNMQRTELIQPDTAEVAVQDCNP